MADGDPYGRDIPTRLPRPGDEDAPEPPQRARRRRRLPVAPRDIRAALDALLRREEPAFAGAVEGAILDATGGIRLADIEAAIADGRLDEQWVARLRERYAELVVDELAPRWFAAQRAGAAPLVAVILGDADGGIRLAPLGARLNDWVRQRGGDFVRDISASQRDALRALLDRYAVHRPSSARTLARLIVPLVGLTERQALTLATQAERMLADGATADAVERWLAGRRTRAIRMRAETIARTELAFAYNFGAHHVMREVEAQAPPGGGGVSKRWHTAADERTCPFCGALHDQVVGIDETFPGATSIMPNTLVPPAHPRCRCVVLYEVDDPA